MHDAKSLGESIAEVIRSEFPAWHAAPPRTRDADHVSRRAAGTMLGPSAALPGSRRSTRRQTSGSSALATSGNSGFLVGWGTLSLINAGLAQSKGRGGGTWWLVSLLLGPIATLLIVVLPPVDLDAGTRPED